MPKENPKDYAFHANQVATLTVEDKQVTAVLIDLAGYSDKLLAGLLSMVAAKNTEQKFSLEFSTLVVDELLSIPPTVFVVYAKNPLDLLVSKFPDTKLLPASPGMYMVQHRVHEDQTYVLGDLDANLDGFVVTKARVVQNGVFLELCADAEAAIVNAVATALGSPETTVEEAVQQCAKIVGDALSSAAD